MRFLPDFPIAVEEVLTSVETRDNWVVSRTLNKVSKGPIIACHQPPPPLLDFGG
jgi:hypothetical protein